MAKKMFIQRANSWNGKADKKHFFFNYPNKKVTNLENFRPYIPMSQRTDNEYSVDLNQYNDIIEAYFEVAVEEMMEGKPFRFSSDIGELRLVRYKARKSGRAMPKLHADLKKQGLTTQRQIDEAIKKDPSLIDKYSYYNNHLQGYKFNLAWFRKGWNIHFANYWNMRMHRKLWMKVWNALKEDPSMIYKFSDSTKAFI